MERTFKIAELISTDIRTRANADIIRSAVNGVKCDIILDFIGVTFISRSFADELYNVMDEYKNITLTNEEKVVKSMLDAVSQSRRSKRNPIEDNAEMRKFDDMASLSSFLSTI